MFRYSTLAGGENAPAPAASELIEIVRHRPVWDEITIAKEDAQFPRAGLSWHEGHGLVLHCFEDEMSWGFFLAEPGSLTSPEIDIVLGGQVQERWPRQLFVDPSLGAEALDHFLETGQRKETLHWIPHGCVSSRDCVGRASGPRGVGKGAATMRTKVRQASPTSEEGLTAKVRRLPAVHPGEILSEDLMTPLGLSINGLARLARYFAMTPYFWMNLQAAYDLDVATRASADRIRRDVHPRGAV